MRTASPDLSAVRQPEPSLLWRATPLAFVLIWSTGFVVARYAMPHAGPFTFLAIRFALSLLALGVWIALARIAWPQGRAQWLHLAVAGALMHAAYLGGVWAAVKGGMSAGTVALIVGLQPVLTALWLSAVGTGAADTGGAGSAGGAGGQRVRAQQWLGLVLGLLGLVLVVWRKLGAGEAQASTIALAALALLGITAGTLYQKRFAHDADPRAASFVQLLAAFGLMLPLALLEPAPLNWHPHLIGAMAWSVLVLTLGGSSLLILLLQRGAATSVSSLMYLVPPCTALLAWLLFGEALTPLVLAGLALTAVGVWLVLRDAQAAAAPGHPEPATTLTKEQR